MISIFEGFLSAGTAERVDVWFVALNSDSKTFSIF